MFCMDELQELDYEPLIKSMPGFLKIKKIKAWGGQYAKFSTRALRGQVAGTLPTADDEIKQDTTRSKSVNSLHNRRKPVKAKDRRKDSTMSTLSKNAHLMTRFAQNTGTIVNTNSNLTELKLIGMRIGIAAW